MPKYKRGQLFTRPYNSFDRAGGVLHGFWQSALSASWSRIYRISLLHTQLLRRKPRAGRKDMRLPAQHGEKFVYLSLITKTKIMKKFTLFALALLLSMAAMGGNNNRLPLLSVGIKAGYNSNQQKIDYRTLINMDQIKRNASGFNAGIVARVDFPLLPIYVQGELLYDWGKYQNINVLATTMDVTTNNFSVPVMLGIGIGSSSFVKVRANLGPVFNLVSSAKLSDGNITNLENMFTRQTVTWTAGIGVDIFRIMVDIRYNGVFSKKEISNIKNFASVNTSPTSWSFSIGYLF